MIANLPDAIEHLLQADETEYPGALVTGWVVVYELVDPADGEKVLRLREAPNLTAWTRAGMLHTAMQGDWCSVDEEADDA